MQFKTAIWLGALATLTFTSFASAQDGKKFDGKWNGPVTCNESSNPNALSKSGFTNNLTFNVDNGRGTATFESSGAVDIYELKVSDSSVSIKSEGKFKNDPLSSWQIWATGSASGAIMLANGPLYSRGKVLRSKCEFVLNREVTEPPIQLAPRPETLSAQAPIPVAANGIAPARTAAMANVIPTTSSVQSFVVVK